MGVGALIFQLG